LLSFLFYCCKYIFHTAQRFYFAGIKDGDIFQVVSLNPTMTSVPQQCITLQDFPIKKYLTARSSSFDFMFARQPISAKARESHFLGFLGALSLSTNFIPILDYIILITTTLILFLDVVTT
jgi:hypothetical protein